MRAREIFGKTVRHATVLYVHVLLLFSSGKLSVSFSLDTVVNIYIKTMVEDDDKETVAQACTSMADIIKDYGGAVGPCKFCY